MATFYTEYQEVQHFFVLLNGDGEFPSEENEFHGPDFFFADFDMGFSLHDEFTGAGLGRILDLPVGGNQNATHRTGYTGSEVDPNLVFTIVGSGLTGTSLTVNRIVIDNLEGGTLDLRGSYTLPTTGLTVDNFSGTVNSFTHTNGTPGAIGYELFEFTGALTNSATSGSATVSRIHVERIVGAGDLEDEPYEIIGTVTGTNIKFDDDDGVISGTVTGISIRIDGTLFEGSGFSVNAKIFFDAYFDSEFDDETLFSAMGSGADTVTGGGSSGQILSGYAGNDVLIAGTTGTTFIGGAGNDIFDFNGYGDHSIVEIAGATGGIDTIRTDGSYGLGDSNVERLVLLGLNNISGDGNAGNNTITGNASDNELDGMEGADSVVGGGGSDTFHADNVGDKFGAEAADASTDTIYSSVNQTLLANFENLFLEGTAVTGTGNASDNFIDGNEAANVLSGLAGNDQLGGGSGNDNLSGGDGNDNIQGGAGANTILGGGGNDTIEGGDSIETDNDKIDAGAGDDSVDGGEGADSLAGGAGADSIYGASEADTITGGDGNDDLDGGDHNDRIDGGGGDDTIDAGSLPGDVNTLIGGAGNDIFYTDLFADSIVGGAGIDTIFETTGGATNTLTLEGTTENLTFSSDEGAKGVGNALANVFTSGTGADTFVGGTGNDTYNVNNSTDVADEVTGGGGNADLVRVGGNVNYALGGGIERLTMLSSEGNSGTGNELNNVMTTEAEDAVTLVGGNGNDTYNALWNTTAIENTSTGGNDLVIATLEDEDSFTIGSFIERLTLLHSGEGWIEGIGNTDNNVITGAINANNELYGGAGNADADTLIGGALDDELYGENGADSLVGGAGNDWLEGGSGNDSLAGGLGDDTFFRLLTTTPTSATLDNDVMTDTGGSDTVWFGAVSGGPSMEGGTFNLNLTSQAGFSMIDNLDASDAGGLSLKFNFTGSAGNNRLVGNDQADTLSGAGGNDWLDGGAGADSMIGGLGNDSYVLTILNGGGGNATVSLAEVNEAAGTAGGTGDVMVLTGGAGNTALFSFNLIGADSLSPFEGVDASRASIAMHFNFTGNAAGNLLVGGLGADTAGNGHDTLIGGGGNDTYGVNFGDTVDELTNGGGNADLVIAYLLNEQEWNIGGGIENLTLIDISGDTTLNGVGNELNNRITGDVHADNYLDGDDGNDTLIGGTGSDSLQGGTGADSLVGGLGNDTYILYFDTITGATAVLPDAILDTGGIDTLLLKSGEGVILTHALAATIENLDASILSASESGTNKFTGNALANRIVGGNGKDSIVGGAGNDTLGGGHGEGTDTLDGGLGDDEYLEQAGGATYLISQAGDDITADTMTGGIDSVIVSVAGGHDLLDLTGDHSFLENAKFTGTGSVGIFGNLSANTLIGGAGSDTIFGGDGNPDQTDGDDYLEGAAGNDWLDGSEGADTLIGGAGNDSLVGGYADKDGFGSTELGDSIKGDAGNDTLDGGEGGNDTLLGGDGNDSLWGGNDDHGAAPSDDSMKGEAGNDTLDGGNGNDVLDGGAGNDFLAGSVSGYNDADTLIGGDGADTMWGGNGADSMLGNGGNDVFDNASMAGGNDTMVGGAGDDTYFVDSGDDVITEVAGQGTDSVLSGASSYTLSAAIERLTITEYVVGGNGTGNATANTIVGNSHNNVLAGGGGNDTVTGGGGGDDFNLAHTTAGNVMAIQDFDQLEGDKIGLDGGTSLGALFVGINMSPGAITNGTVATSGAGVPQLVYTYGAGTTAGQLFYDANGSTAGGAVLIATFAGATKPIELTTADFFGFNLA